MDHRLRLVAGLTGDATIAAATVALARRCSFAAGLTAAVVASPALAGSAPVNGELYLSGLSRPIEMIVDPANPGVQIIAEQSGRVRVVNNGVLSGTDMLSLVGNIGSTSNEKGLLGVAIPPQGEGRSDEDWVYFNYTIFPGGFGAFNRTVIARAPRTSPGALTVVEAEIFEVLVIEQDFDNHNGGHIAFGPDGMLYIGMGDGGSGGDPNNRSQSKDQLLGKMLRIDVDVRNPDSETYLIPDDNPFIGATGALVGTLPEIWAFGVRNPWKWSFDDFGCASTDAMIIADVGQENWEEISYQSGDYDPSVAADRLNYGWRHREGAHNFNTSIPSPLPSFVEPFYEYSHGVGFSITGGHVYRGAEMIQNRGRFFFADFVTSRVRSVETDGSGVQEHVSQIFTGGLSYSGASAFSVDEDGEMYILNYGSGQVIRLISPYIAGDLNGDGIVDTADLGILIAAFGTDDTFSDINNDCAVDTADLGILIGNFGL